MKKWLKRVPTPILVALVVLVLAVSGALAYSAWQGTASVVVKESLSVSAKSTSDGVFEDGVWTVEAYPGETKELDLRISNASDITIQATLTTTTPVVGVDVSPTSSTFWIGPEAYVDRTISADVSTSCSPGTYTFGIDISR